MHNELLTIGPFTIYGYGLMIAIGILAAYFLTEIRARKRGLPYEEILSLVIWCIIGGFLSAKLLYWLVEWREFLENPILKLKTFGDGFVVYGGILGGIFSGYLFCKEKKLDFLSFFDLVMPSVAVAQGFGRIGCFLAGCCYGKETQKGISVIFHNSMIAPNGIPLIPTQLYSSALNFIHAAVLLYIAGRTKRKGEAAGFYLIFYSSGRFFIEFLRGDLIRGSVGIFSTSQVIAMFTLILGIAVLWKARRDSEV